MANLDFSRTTNGSVIVDRNGNIRHFSNPRDITVQTKSDSGETPNTIVIRNGRKNIQVICKAAEITSINDVPFSGTTEEAKLALNDTVFNG